MAIEISFVKKGGRLDSSVVFTGGSARASNDGGNTWTTYSDLIPITADGNWIIEELATPTHLKMSDKYPAQVEVEPGVYQYVTDSGITHISISGDFTGIDMEWLALGLNNLVYFEGDILGSENLSGAFAYCYALEVVNSDISALDMSFLFEDSSAIKYVRGIDSTSATDRTSMFGNSTPLYPDATDRDYIEIGYDWDSPVGTPQIFVNFRSIDGLNVQNFYYGNRDVYQLSTVQYTHGNRTISQPDVLSYAHGNREVIQPSIYTLAHGDRTIVQTAISQYEHGNREILQLDVSNLYLDRHLWGKAIELYMLRRELKSNKLDTNRYSLVREVEEQPEAIIIKRANA